MLGTLRPHVLWEGTFCFSSSTNSGTENEEEALHESEGNFCASRIVSPGFKAAELCGDSCVLVQEAFGRPNTSCLTSEELAEGRQTIKPREDSVSQNVVLVFSSS